jgi:hypothetical protein
MHFAAISFLFGEKVSKLPLRAFPQLYPYGALLQEQNSFPI